MRRTTPAIVLVLFLALCPTVATQSEEESAKRTEIRRLMKAARADQMGNQLLAQMMEQARQMVSARMEDNTRAKEIFDVYMTLLTEKIAEIDLVEMSIPIYDKYLSEEEIRGLIAFYESSLGQKLLNVQPQMMQETMQVVMPETMRVVKEIQREIEERFPELKDTQKPQ